jgi:gamma-glutamyl:cysteine ligase YbdK (ATP-grasp superfamily)
VLGPDGGRESLREQGRRTLARLAGLAADLGCEAQLAHVAEVLRCGNGADRQRAAYRRGGMPAVLAGLVAATSEC